MNNYIHNNDNAMLSIMEFRVKILVKLKYLYKNDYIDTK